MQTRRLLSNLPLWPRPAMGYGTGWRFLIDSQYRHMTKSRWRRQSHARVLCDIVLGLLGTVGWLLLLFVFASPIWTRWL